MTCKNCKTPEAKCCNRCGHNKTCERIMHCGEECPLWVPMTNLLTFSHRLELSELFDKWANENKADKSPLSVITFLVCEGLIAIDKTHKYLKDKGQK